jgi:hypothetical protein
MKICTRFVMNKRKATSYSVLTESTITVDSLTFDLSSGARWPAIAKESGGRIMSAYRDESGEVCVELRVLGPSAPEGVGEYVHVEPTGGEVGKPEVLTIQAQDEIDEAAGAEVRCNIQAKLGDLDNQVSRSAENMIEDGVYRNPSARELAVIEEKKRLRAELASLG